MLNELHDMPEGLLEGIDTSGGNAGDSVWLSSTAGGRVYGSPPAEPAHAVYLGVVVRSSATNGKIQVKVQNGYELDELHGVQITTPTNQQALTYNSTSGLWENTTRFVIAESEQTITQNYTLTTGKNGSSVGPVTIARASV